MEGKLVQQIGIMEAGSHLVSLHHFFFDVFPVYEMIFKCETLKLISLQIKNYEFIHNGGFARISDHQFLECLLFDFKVVMHEAGQLNSQFW